MEDNVVPFRKVPTTADLEARTHELSLDTKNIRFDNPHFQARLKQRGLTMRQVLEVLRKGNAASSPVEDQYGDWRIKLKRLVAGRRVQVVVAIKVECLLIVTAI